MQRMIVIPTDVFTKLKNLLDNDKNLDILDQNMKKVLYSKNLNSVQKWYMYRQNLMKYGDQKRRVSLLPTKYGYHNPSSKNAETQTKFKLLKNKETQSTPLHFDNIKQLGDDVFNFDPVKEKQQQHYTIDDDVFYSADQQQQQPNRYQYRDKTDKYMDVDDDGEWDEEEEVQKLALKEIAPDERLTRRLSANTNIRMFDTNKGDIITVALPDKSPINTRQRAHTAGSFIRQSILSKYPEDRNPNKRKLSTIKKSPPKQYKLSTPPHLWTAYK